MNLTCYKKLTVASEHSYPVARKDGSKTMCVEKVNGPSFKQWTGARGTIFQVSRLWTGSRAYAQVHCCAVLALSMLLLPVEGLSPNSIAGRQMTWKLVSRMKESFCALTQKISSCFSFFKVLLYLNGRFLQSISLFLFDALNMYLNSFTMTRLL